MSKPASMAFRTIKYYQDTLNEANGDRSAMVKMFGLLLGHSYLGNAILAASSSLVVKMASGMHPPMSYLPQDRL